jgi:uncharacterized membrane protein SpoIIM required for sporulation
MAEPLPAFVARRRPDWIALERLLERQSARALGLEDILALDRLYRRAGTDLAAAQALYPSTDAHRFLNQLCGRAYAAIYRPPRQRARATWRFFAREFPAAVRGEARYVAISAALLVLGVLMGAIWVGADPAAARWVLPEGLREAVADHRMWTDDLVGVAPAAASSSLATNNLTVTVMLFASGLTFGLGTAYLLIVNGMLLGAAAVVCARAGMTYALLSFIGGHGPVELSVIALAGGAGLILGHAMIDPGERPRGAHLQARAGQAVRLLLGCAPFLALIALIEGFVSPGQLLPGWLKIGLGLSLGAALWGYLLLAGRETSDLAPAGSASVQRPSR